MIQREEKTIYLNGRDKMLGCPDKLLNPRLLHVEVDMGLHDTALNIQTFQYTADEADI